MEITGLFDSPVSAPKDDLLEMQTAARELARQIPNLPMPFTIGIYGEWGTGKTSFVKLVQSFLATQPHGEEREIVFADFTAWPHRTSDELWRALILCIARALYKVQQEAKQPPPDDGGRPGLLKRLAGLLSSDALMLDAPAPPIDPLADYRKLVARLDRTGASCDKSSDQTARLDQEQVMLATVQGAIAALGSLSPLIASLRGLLGLDDGPRAAELLQRERNEATRERIESIQELRAILSDLFGSEENKDRCVCVFIDDLDRCMPDVALDLLEAIKVFFTDGVHCVFLVAADAQLIGRGLQLRFKELAGNGASESTEQLFARKGQEYFEKIIQLGIPVPQPTSEQTYRLIAVHFPRCLPASDILRAAIGDNPRRLKQYCNLLQYRLGVSWAQTGKGIDAEMEQLEKLIQLRSSGRQPLQEMPEMPSGEAQILYQLADVRPDPNDVLRTGDAPFLRIFQMLELPSTEHPLMLQDMTRLVSLRGAPAFFLEALGQIARSGRWMAEMQALEKALDQRAPKPPEKPSLEPSTVKLFWEATDPDSSKAAAEPFDLRAALVDQKPRLSALLPEEVLAFLEIRKELPQPEELLTQAVYSQASEANKDLALAREALNRLGDYHEAIELGLGLRLRAAQRFLELRRFAKLDALRHCWPHLERLLRGERWSDRVKLLEIERQALGEESRKSDFLKDEKLESFLKLRPLFRDLYPDDHMQYLKAAQATEGLASVLQPPTSPAPGLAIQLPTSAFTEHPKSAPAAHNTETEALDYESATLSLVPTDPAAPEGRCSEYMATLTCKEESESCHVVFPWEEIDVAIRALSNSIHETGFPQQRSPARDVEVARELRPREMQELGMAMRELGEKLYDLIFPESKDGGNLRGLLMKLLETVPFLRLLLDMSRSELMDLPWESLYIRKTLRSHLALSQKWSLVRHFPSISPRAQRPPLPPLRILAMLPSPRNAAPLNVEGELNVLERSLAAAIKSNLVQLQVLSPGEATVEQLNRRLRVFKPHLFHFVGHGLFSEPHHEGAIVCENNDGKAFVLQASTLATFLNDHHVQLAVLNACDTATGAVNDAITGVAGALINSGLPAVIATLRPISDNAALLFTREFYRAFVEGCQLETALTEARKILSAEKFDWSAYALFTSLKDLDFFRLSAEATRQ